MKLNNKKIMLNFSFILSIIIMNILISLIFVQFILSGKELTPIQNNNILKESCERNITREIELIARNISQGHKYKLNEYDCTEFSRDLVKNLSAINVSSYCVFGSVKKENNLGIVYHTWIEVLINNETYPIEATGGYFIDNKTYIERYKKLNRGFCL